MAEPEVIVRGILAYILHLTSCFGLTPLKFVKVEDGYSIRLSVLVWIYGYSLTIIMDTIILYGLKERSIIEAGNGGVPDLVHLTSSLKTMVVLTAAVFTAPFRITKMKAIFIRIREIHSQVKTPGDAKNLSEKKHYIFVNSYLLLAAFLMVTDLYLVFGGLVWKYDSPIIYAEHTMSYCQEWLVSLLSVEIVTVAFWPYLVLKSINNDLASILNDNFWKISKTETKRLQETIRRLINCCTPVSAVIRQINDVNAIVILAVLVARLFQIVISAYYLIEYIFSRHLSAVWIFLQVLWLLLGIINLAILVEPGYQTEQEVAKTSVLLSKLLNEVSTSSPILEKELEHFHRILELNDFSHQPMGACQFSRSLAVTILGSVTTYLVVIIQMKFGS